MSELPLPDMKPSSFKLGQASSYSGDLKTTLFTHLPGDKASTSRLTETFQKQMPKMTCTTQSWENEDLYHEVQHLVLIRRSYLRGHLPPRGKSRSFSVLPELGILINIRDLFGSGPHTVILYGYAGVGKSTLARQVRRAWEEGHLYRDHFQHVFYFNCRQLSPTKTMSLTELVTEVGAAPETAIGQILSQPEKLLFILEGLHEPQWDLVKQKHDLSLQQSQKQPLCSLLSRLLSKTILPEASLLITARTRALEKFIPYLEHPQWVEVLGFSESGRKDYFRKYFTDEGQAHRALSLAVSNHALWAMCLVPWVSWLVCTCLKQQMEQGRELSLRPQTTTALCLQYLSQALPAQPLGTQLRGLCSLAAEGNWEEKSLFSEEDLKEHGVEGTVVSTLLQMGILRQHPTPQSYSFIHLGFHRFFAAMSCVLECSKEESDNPTCTVDIREQLKKCCGHDVIWAPTMHFLLGLLGEQGVKTMESIFNCTLSRVRRQELLTQILDQGISPELERSGYFFPQSRSLQLFRCLYEIQDKDFLTQVMNHFRERSMIIETNMELRVFTFCIQFCRRVQRLQLNGDEESKLWNLPSMVLFTCFRITDASWQILFSVPGVTGSLTELDLSRNTLSPSAVQSLCEALRCPRCTLETLRLVRCGLTSSSCQDLASVLSTSPRLTELDLQQNDLGDLGMRLLCEGLRQPACQLRVLRLVRCGLTSSSCQDLASALSTSPRLTELDLQQNDLGNLGVRLLCEGLRQSACQLRVLRLDQAGPSEEVTGMLIALQLEKPQLNIYGRWLDQAGLSEKVRGMLRVLQKEKPWLHIYERWMPIVTTPEEKPKGGEMSDNTPTLEQQGPESEGSPHQVARVEPTCLSSPAPLGDRHMELLTTKDEFWGPTGHVAIEVIDHERSMYRVHFPTAGSYHWPNTGLHFVVRGSVTIEIEFCSWDPFLGMIARQDNWMVAGPLLDIKAEPGAVATVYLPHFVSLQGNHVDTSQFHVAHFKEEGMLLEEPSRVETSYIVLENPSFSPMGVFLRILTVTGISIPITSTVMLYHQLRPKEINFHLYLIPNDCTIRKAIDDEEKKFQFVQIRKPPPQTQLHVGSRFIVSGSDKMDIMPQELELCYRSPGKSQVYSEISVGQLVSGIRLQITNKEDGTVVWEALVRQGDLRPSAALDPPAPPGSPSPPGSPRSAHFLDQYREQLVAGVTSVDPVLDKLYGQVLSVEQYDTIRAEATTQGQMRKLFSFSRSWDRACKDRLYQALKDTQPYLIMDLLEKSISGGH